MTATERLLAMPNEELGKLGEAVWARVFECSGVLYLPLCKIEAGGAPKLGGVRNGILPDFEVMIPQRTVYVESKAKRRDVLYRNASEIRHGINRSCYESYMRVRSLCRRRCGIGILELERWNGSWSGALLIESLPNLGEPIQGFSSQGHMVYWPRKRFVDLHSLTPEEVLTIARGKPVESFRAELMRIFGIGVEEFQLDLL